MKRASNPACYVQLRLSLDKNQEKEGLMGEGTMKTKFIFDIP
jgi:hypothetical protein